MAPECAPPTNESVTQGAGPSSMLEDLAEDEDLLDMTLDHAVVESMEEAAAMSSQELEAVADRATTMMAQAINTKLAHVCVAAFQQLPHTPLKIPHYYLPVSYPYISSRAGLSVLFGPCRESAWLGARVQK